MSISREIKFELNDLLSLLICSEYYDFNHEILYRIVAEKIVTLSDVEIDNFILNSKTESGEQYTEEESEYIKNYLISVRDMYIK